VNSGNFFNQRRGKRKRYQALEVYSFSPPKFARRTFIGSVPELGKNVGVELLDAEKRFQQ